MDGRAKDEPTLIKIKISFSFAMQSWIIHLLSDPDGHWIKDQIIPDNPTAGSDHW